MTGPALIVGLTGGIGSGKTEVLRRLAKRRIATVSSDVLAHEALKPSSRAAYSAVVQHFGPQVLDERGSINRRELADIVFRNPRERRWLEQAVHPWVIRGLKAFADRHKGIVVLEIPLLFEARLEDLVEVTVCVWCRPDQQMSRVQKRSGLSEGEIRARMKAQWPLQKKAKRSDVVIDNSRGLAHLNREVEKLLNILRRRFRERKGLTALKARV